MHTGPSAQENGDDGETRASAIAAAKHLLSVCNGAGFSVSAFPLIIQSEIENYITGSCEFWHALTLTLAWIPSHFDL